MPTWTLSIFFLMLGGAIAKHAFQNGGVWLILLWPAAAFVAVALAYWKNNPSVFGKQSDGTMTSIRSTLLGPFLAFSWLSWQVNLLASRQPAWQRVTEKLYIGRRLRGGDPLPDVRNVLDLTAEFAELPGLRVLNYRNIALLDGSTPETGEFIAAIAAAKAAAGPTYIHCAMGHGRTGLAAATWLMLEDRSRSPEAAVRMLQQSRRSLELNRSQWKSLYAIHALIASRPSVSNAVDVGGVSVPPLK